MSPERRGDLVKESYAPVALFFPAAGPLFPPAPFLPFPPPTISAIVVSLHESCLPRHLLPALLARCPVISIRRQSIPSIFSASLIERQRTIWPPDNKAQHRSPSDRASADILLSLPGRQPHNARVLQHQQDQFQKLPADPPRSNLRVSPSRAPDRAADGKSIVNMARTVSHEIFKFACLSYRLIVLHFDPVA